jgi:hypothetical protein
LLLLVPLVLPGEKIMQTTSIREHMSVFGSCGQKVGTVDHLEGDSIKLTKKDSPDGMHHFIPTSWVEKVDDAVRLNKDCGSAQKEWKSAP